ncbi:MAG: electron transfer flavoprotein subunit alpha/FixB family protein [Bacteroidota bacterium]
MSVLVFAESKNGKIAKSNFEAASYGARVAAAAGTTASVITYGNAGDELKAFGEHGISKVLVLRGQDNLDAGQVTKLVAAAAEKENASIVIFSNDLTGKAVAPRLSVKMNAGLVAGAVALPQTTGTFTVKVNVFSGKASAEVEVHAEKKIIAVQPNSVGIEKISASVTIEDFTAEIGSPSVKVKEVKKNEGEISLPEAELVVSAGRGLKGPENWGMIEELAKELRAATACSRPVADIGWRPHHEHVGQTGIAIAPNLYIAIGISGAIQHLAGVNRSKVIVVINSDPEAPFFKAADYGIVGDAFQVVPQLIEAVKKLKASH